MEKSISYIIPVFNGEKTIFNCIESVLQMPYCTEIIVVDDGSVDNTDVICSNLADKFKDKIKYIRQKNQGVSAARNTGLKIAKGDYIGFVDADDRVDNTDWSGLKIAFDSDAEIIMFDYNEFNNNERKIVSAGINTGINNENVCNKLISWMLNMPIADSVGGKYIGGKIYQYFYDRAFLKCNNICFSPDVVFAEDLCFVIKCLSNCKKLYYWNITGYNYYIYEGSASHRFREQFWDELKRTYKSLNESVANKEILNGVYYYFAKVAIHNYISNYRKIGAKQIKSYIKNIISDGFVHKDLYSVRQLKWSFSEKTYNFLIKHKLVAIFIFIEVCLIMYKEKKEKAIDGKII